MRISEMSIWLSSATMALPIRPAPPVTRILPFERS